jgi:hypothetical protein
MLYKSLILFVVNSGGSSKVENPRKEHRLNEDEELLQRLLALTNRLVEVEAQCAMKANELTECNVRLQELQQQVTDIPPPKMITIPTTRKPRVILGVSGEKERNIVCARH